MTQHSFTLSYVNDADATTTYDHAFSSIHALMGFVDSHHPRFTSYQVIVTPAAPEPMTEQKFDDLNKRST